MEHSKKYDAAAMNLAYTFGKLFETLGKALQEAGEDLLATADLLHDSDEAPVTFTGANGTAPISATNKLRDMVASPCPNGAGLNALPGSTSPTAQDEGVAGVSPEQGSPAAVEGAGTPAQRASVQGDQGAAEVTASRPAVTAPGPVKSGPGPEEKPAATIEASGVITRDQAAAVARSTAFEKPSWKDRPPLKERIREEFTRFPQHPEGLAVHRFKHRLSRNSADCGRALDELVREGYLAKREHLYFLAADAPPLPAPAPAPKPPASSRPDVALGAPVDRPENRVKGHVELTAHGRDYCRIAVDTKACVIAGPRGELRVAKAVLDTYMLLASIPEGSFMDAQKIADKCGYRGASMVTDNLPFTGKDIAEKTGIKLITFGRNLFRLEIAP